MRETAKSAPGLVRIVVATLAATTLGGCDASSGLFSEAERRSIYSLSLYDSAETRIAPGAALEPGFRLVPEFSFISGAAEAVALELSIKDAGGAERPLARYATREALPARSGLASAEEAETSFREFQRSYSVAKLAGQLEAFAVPEDLEPGMYALAYRVLGREGAELKRGTLVFFVGSPGLAIESVSLYPPQPVPAQAVLLAATLGPTGDPWLRWSYEGRVVAEGYRSRGFDKAVWRAPLAVGVYTIRLELFPSDPALLGTAYAGPSPWRQELKAIVSGEAAADEFSDASEFVSHFAFDGDCAELGTRAIETEPVLEGRAVLDMYGRGFGYRLGAATTLRAPGALPPLSSGGALRPFSILWRLGDLRSAASGDLARFVDATGTSLFRVGLDDGRPFLVWGSGDDAVLSSAPVRVGGGGTNIALDLALGFEPSGEKTRVTWTLDGVAYEVQALPLKALGGVHSLVLGGPGSLEAIYDEFALRDDSRSGPPPLYRAARARAEGRNLVFASGFEPRTLPTGLVATGEVRYGGRRCVLAPGARLALASPVSLERGMAVELAFAEGGSPPLVEITTPEGDRLATVRGAGEIATADGLCLGFLKAERGVLAFSLRLAESSLEILPHQGLPGASLPMPRVMAVGLAIRPAEDDSLELRRFLVRRAPELVTATPRPSLARFP